MARDLTREIRQPRNGAAEVAAVVDEALSHEPLEAAAPSEPYIPMPPTDHGLRPAPPEHLEARRDWMLARVALMLIDAAKLLDPLTRIVVNRLMPPLSLACSAGICVYALMLTEGWQRVAVAGIFTALAALWIRRGMA